MSKIEANSGVKPLLPSPAFEDSKHHIKIYQGDCLEILAKIPEDTVDLVFADTPYFLSNGGITCQAGRMVSVNKGEWDKSRGADANHEFNRAWLAACQRVLKPNGSIWVSGTAHVIHSVGFAMQRLGFKLLNDISWVKPNPSPNLSCRYFTHATETIIWAAKNIKSRYTFHYKLMKEINRGKQMKSVWEIYPPEAWEKKFGKHPTQKPVALLERIRCHDLIPRVNLNLPTAGLDCYKSASQRARVGTESWGASNFFCPACESPHLQASPQGTAAIDFGCPSCDSPFQLKSQSKPIRSRIVEPRTRK